MKVTTRLVRGVLAGVAVVGIVAASLVGAEAAYAADGITITPATASAASNVATTYTLTYSCSTTGGCANSVITIPTTAAQLSGDGSSVTDFSSWFTNGTCPTMTKTTGQVSFAVGSITTGTASCTFTVKAPNKTTLNGAKATIIPTFTNTGGGSTTATPAVLTFTAGHNASLGASATPSVFTGAPMTLTFTFSCGSTTSTGDLGLSAINISDVLPANFTFTSISTAPATLAGTITKPAAGTSGGTITYASTTGADCLNPANNRIVFTVNGNASAGGAPDPVGATICHSPTSTFTYVDGTPANSTPGQKCGSVVDINYLASKGSTVPTLGNGGQYKALDNTVPGKYTFPGDWDQTGGDTDYVLTEATSPVTTSSGLSYLIQDPLPCIDHVSGADYVGSAVGVACAHPAYVPKKITATGFTPTSADSINLLFADGTTGSVPYVSGTGWTLPATPAISEIDIPAFTEEGSNSVGTMVFTVTGYATATDVPGHILHNVATTTAYFTGSTTTVKTQQLRGTDILVANPVSPGGTVVYPSLTATYDPDNACVDSVAFSSSTNGAFHNRIEIARAPSAAITLDYLSPQNVVSITGTTISFSLVGQGGHTYTASNVAATQTPNYEGTGRTLVEWIIPAGTASVPGDYLINAVGFSVQLPQGCAGTYQNAITVGYGDPVTGCDWDNYVSGFEQAAPLLPPGDTALNTNGSSSTNFCGFSAPINITPIKPGFSVDKTVQGNLDATTVSAGGVGKVSPSGGSATYDVTFTNTGSSNLHDPVMYDLLPRVGDTEATSTTARGSDFAVQLTSVTTPPTGVTIEYSTVPNPCRPEVLANASNPGCISDWSATPPSPLSSTTALRIAYSGTVGVNGSPFSQAFSVSYDVATPTLAVGSTGWNTVGTNVHVGDTGDDNPTDDPFLGAAESSRTGLTASTNSPAIVKASTQSTYSAPGDVINYTFDVTNTEAVPLTSASVVDSFTDAPSGATAPSVTCQSLTSPTGTCSGATTPLQPGQTAHFIATYHVTQADIDHGKLSDSATVTGQPETGSPISNTSNVVTVNAAVNNGLSLVKTSPTATYSVVGGEIDYDFVLKNTGNQTLHGLSVDDALLADVTCPVNSLAPNATTTCAGSYDATQADIDTGSIVNTATASALDPTGDAVNSDPSSFTVDATQTPALTLTKSASVSTISAVGDPVTFDFAVKNSGNVSLTDVEVNEGTFTGTGTLSGVDCPGTSLAPNDTMTCTATYAATQQDLDNGAVSNTATVTGLSPQDVPVTSASSTATVSTESDAALTLTKTADVSTITTVGQVVTYSFEIANTGNVTVTNVIVQEGHFTGTGTLSAVDCPAGVASMAPGDDLTCTATYAVTAADLKSGTLSNTAVASGSNGVSTVASSDSTAAVTADPATAPTDPTAPPVLGYTGVDAIGPLMLGIGLFGLGGVILLIRRRRRNA